MQELINPTQSPLRALLKHAVPVYVAGFWFDSSEQATRIKEQLSSNLGPLYVLLNGLNYYANHVRRN